jgi:hypothetical protein
MIIKVLGSGCANCQKLGALAEKAAAQLGIDAEIVKVTDYADIMRTASCPRPRSW